MSWIKTITDNEAQGRLKILYQRIKGPQDHIDNILLLHSLRPHTLEGHMALYKSTLHHSGNRLPKWVLECVGIYVSHINGCRYCVEHHFQGLKRLIKDDIRSQQLLDAMENHQLEPTFEHREAQILNYAEQLTRSPHQMKAVNIENLRKTGLTDGEILEVNQVSSYFAYANRTVLGLGCNTEGDILGLSPNVSDDPNNWGHR